MEAFSELSKVFDNGNDETILNWLKNSSNTAVLESLSSRFTKCPKKYSLLLQKDIFPLPASEKMVCKTIYEQNLIIF